MNTTTTNPTTNRTTAGRRNRIARGAAALVVAASATLGTTALATIAGAQPLVPGPLPGGDWVLPESAQTLPPISEPRFTLPSTPTDIIIPEGGLDPITPIPPLPPAWTDEGDGGVITEVPTDRVPDPSDVIADLGTGNRCLAVYCGEDPIVPQTTVPTTPDPTVPRTPDPNVPDPTVPEPTPVRTGTPGGTLAFTGSDALLPVAGVGLLGAGGMLAGISVLAHRVRNRRS